MTTPKTAAWEGTESSAQNSQMMVDITRLSEDLSISAAESSRIESAATQMVTLSIAGKISGTTISLKVRRSEAPLIQAASSSSLCN